MKRLILFMTVLVLLSRVVRPWQANGAQHVVSGEICQIDGNGAGWVDDLKIDRITFDVDAETYAVFDVLAREIGEDLNADGELTGFDSYVMLFAGNTLLAENDDYPYGNPLNQDGSIHSWDSAFAYTFNTAGSYMLTVGAYGYAITPGDSPHYTEAEALQGYDPFMNFHNYADPFNGPNHGDWQLTIRWYSGDVSNVQLLPPAPEPSTLGLLGIGAIGLLGCLWRRHR